MQEKRLPPPFRTALLLGLCLLVAALVLFLGGGAHALGAPPRQADDVFLTATSMAATLQAVAATATAEAGAAHQFATATANAVAVQTVAAQTTALVEQMTATAAALNPATSTPAPTRTATPTTTAARAAPAPTRRPAAPAARAEAEALVQGLNVRSGPGTSYSVVGSAALGQVFPVSGQSGGCAWLRVTLPGGGIGWVSGSPSFTRLYTACANVPAASAPAPAPAASAPPASAASAAPAVSAAPAARGPGLVTTFEPLGGWRRGDQPYGTLASSAEQVADGAASAKLTYDFPAAAGAENYVVFLAQPPLAIPSGATGLRLKVHGDGAGHFLNAWIGDANGQVWQTTFGRLSFRGWDEVSATLAPRRDWPNGPISATSKALTPPLTLRALVFDSTLDGKDSAGAIYLDALAASTSAAGSPDAAAPAASAAIPAAPAAESAAAAPAAPPVAAPLSGRIAVPQASGAGVSTVVYDAARGTVVMEIANARQPDLAGDVLLVNREGGPDTIMRVSLATRDERPVTINAEDAYPQWSPSRASVVYASNKVGDRRWRIYLQEDATDQQDVSPLLVEGNELFGNYPVYLDNWRIAYNGCDTWSGGSRCGIYAADSRGSRPVRVTDSPDDIPSGHLGSRVLFTARRAGNYDVWSANWDGSGLQQLTTDGANDGLAAGSPDGQTIAFVSDRGGQWALWLMNADGSGQRKAFALPAVPGGPAGWLTERIGWGM